MGNMSEPVVDRRLPSDVVKEAERYRKLRTALEKSISAGIEAKTEKLYNEQPKQGEEFRLYLFTSDIKHQKEFFGKTLDEVIDLLPV